MRVNRGDIVLVDFPYSNHTGSKIRPALVVQADVWNQRLNSTMLAGITSNLHRGVGDPTQYFIDVETVDGQQSGLRFNSVVRCDKLATSNQSRIQGIIGRLSEASMEEIDTCLKAALDIQ
ncbi:MAG: type II toxin-antitoxin system PemK/MazF family toxin [Candidatus Poribacteria bacterium]|nr:type II toxin-antitoxin system PemK/MazF family toxin [Candidatus Poribacteria bacterium]